MSENLTNKTSIKWTQKEQYGFSSEVPTEIRVVYMKSLMVCANGDGELAQEERDWVLGLAAAMGMPSENLKEL